MEPRPWNLLTAYFPESFKPYTVRTRTRTSGGLCATAYIAPSTFEGLIYPTVPQCSSSSSGWRKRMREVRSVYWSPTSSASCVIDASCSHASNLLLHKATSHFAVTLTSPVTRAHTGSFQDSWHASMLAELLPKPPCPILTCG